MFKPISHAERTLNPRQVSYRKHLCKPYKVYSTTDSLENNRIVKRSAIVTVDPRDKFVGVRVSDFYLENILAVGADGNLRECSLRHDTFTCANMLDQYLSSMDAYIVDHESQNQPDVK